MAYGKPEQIDKGEWCVRYKKWLKRVAKRRRRRLEKRGKYLSKNEYYGYSM